MALYIGLLLGISAMLGFGIYDFYLAMLARRIGTLNSVFWFQLGTVMLYLSLYVSISFVFHSAYRLSLLDIIMIIGAALLGILPLIAYVKGLRSGSVSVVSATASGWGAVTAILAILILKESLSYLKILLIALIVAGTVAVSYSRSGKKLQSTGALYGIAALLGWGVFFFIAAIIVSRVGWLAFTVLQSIPSTAFAYAFCKAGRSKVFMKKKDILLLAVVCVIGTAAFIVYNIGVGYGNYVSIVAPISAASPMITITMAYLLLGERMELSQKIGIVAILAGIILLAI